MPSPPLLTVAGLDVNPRRLIRPFGVNRGGTVHPLNWGNWQIQRLGVQVVEHSEYVKLRNGGFVKGRHRALPKGRLLDKDFTIIWYWARENIDMLDQCVDEVFKSFMNVIESQMKEKTFKSWRKNTRGRNDPQIVLYGDGKADVLYPHTLMHTTKEFPFLIYNSLFHNTQLRRKFRDISEHAEYINNLKDPMKWGAIDGYNLASLIALAQAQQNKMDIAVNGESNGGLSLAYKKYTVHLLTPATPKVGLFLFSATISSRYLAALKTSSLDQLDQGLVITKEFLDLSNASFYQSRHQVASRFTDILESAYTKHQILSRLPDSHTTLVKKRLLLPESSSVAEFENKTERMRLNQSTGSPLKRKV